MQITLQCKNCHKPTICYLSIAGPHISAHCSECEKFIKFLSKDDKAQALRESLMEELGIEEDY